MVMITRKFLKKFHKAALFIFPYPNGMMRKKQN
jgi:hypothetical protein